MLWTFFFSTITLLIDKHKVKAHQYLPLSMFFFPIILWIYFSASTTSSLSSIANDKWQPNNKLTIFIIKHHEELHNKINKPFIVKTKCTPRLHEQNIENTFKNTNTLLLHIHLQTNNTNFDTTKCFVKSVMVPYH
jgi:hypothetical protein